MLNNIDDLNDFDRTVGTTMAVCAGLTLCAVLGFIGWAIYEFL